MTTITALNVRLGMDVSNFSEGANLAKSETNRVAAIMRQSVPAAEKYKQELDLLNRTFSESGKQSKQYADALEFLRKKHGVGVPVITETQRAVEGLKQSMLAAVPGGNILANALRGPTGQALALAAAVAFVSRELSHAATKIDETAKAAKTAGIAYADLVALQMLASESAGVGAEQVNRGIREMSKRLAEARVSGGKLAEALAAVGVSVNDLASKDAGQQFRVIADVIASTPDKAEQLRIATLALGRNGAEMIEVFRAGGGALDDMTREANRLGVALSAEAVAGVEKMNDEFGRVTLAIDGVWQTIIANLAPSLTSVAKLIQEIIVFVRQFGGAVSPVVSAFKVIEETVMLIADGLRGAFAIVGDVLRVLQSLPSWIGGGELNLEFEATNRILDEIEAESRQVEGAITESVDAAEALAVEAAKLQDEAEKLTAKYEDRVKQLEIEAIELSGNVALAREMQLIAEGYNAEQIKTLTSLREQNDAIKERIANEKKAADQLRREMEEIDKAFVKDVESALAAAKRFFEEEERKRMQMLKDVAAGPGAGIEAGSADAAKFFADSINKQIGAAAMPEKATPGEEEIARKAEQLFREQRRTNEIAERQVAKASELLDEFRQNGFRRIR